MIENSKTSQIAAVLQGWWRLVFCRKRLARRSVFWMHWVDRAASRWQDRACISSWDTETTTWESILSSAKNNIPHETQILRSTYGIGFLFMTNEFLLLGRKRSEPFVSRRFVPSQRSWRHVLPDQRLSCSSECQLASTIGAKRECTWKGCHESNTVWFQ